MTAALSRSGTTTASGLHSTRGDGSFSGTVIAQRFDANGAKIGGELIVNAKDVDQILVTSPMSSGCGTAALWWPGKPGSTSIRELRSVRIRTIPPSICSSSMPTAARLAERSRSIRRGTSTSGIRGSWNSPMVTSSSYWKDESQTDRRSNRLCDQGADPGCEWQQARRRVRGQHHNGGRSADASDRRASRWPLHRHMDRQQRAGT